MVDLPVNVALDEPVDGRRAWDVVWQPFDAVGEGRRQQVETVGNPDQFDLDSDLVKTVFRLLIELNKVEQRTSR